jgi:hypothetical protein
MTAWASHAGRLRPGRRRGRLAIVLAFCLLTACTRQAEKSAPVASIASETPVAIASATPSVGARATSNAPEQLPDDGLSPEARSALGTLRQLDSHPLYTMCLCGVDVVRAQAAGGRTGQTAARWTSPWSDRSAPEWGCSLFAALGEPQALLYGRNFDWTTSPALLLYSDPPEGYASVTMVDIAYLGFEGEAAARLADLPLAERRVLLRAPTLPFDGMNEQGLVVGMAAVAAGHMQVDPAKQTIGSLMLMRVILDQARDVDEALSIVERYNIEFGGGPPIHYLIADSTGQAALVEFYQGRLVVLPNEQPWHLATNFLRASVDGSTAGQCWRYDRLGERLESTQGRLDAAEAMALLQRVAQPNTQWSVIYDTAARQVHVALGRGYDTVHTLPFELCGPSCGQ